MNSFHKLLTYGYDFESHLPPYGFNSYVGLPSFTLPIRSLTASSSVMDVRLAVMQSQRLRASTPLPSRGHGVIFNLIRERHYRYIAPSIKGRLLYLETCPFSLDLDSEAAIDLDYRINVFVFLHRIALLRSGFIACVTDCDPLSIMTDTLIDDDDPGLESYAKQLELCGEIFRDPFNQLLFPEYLRCDFEASAASLFEEELVCLFERKAHLEYRLCRELQPVVWSFGGRAIIQSPSEHCSRVFLTSHSSTGVSPATPGHNTQVLPTCLPDAPGHLSNVHASSVTRGRHIDSTKIELAVPVDRTVVADSTVMAPGHFASAISTPATSAPAPAPKKASSRPVDFCKIDAQSSSVAGFHTLGSSSTTSDNIVPDQSSSSLAPGHVLCPVVSPADAPHDLPDDPSASIASSTMSPSVCDSLVTASPTVPIDSSITLHSPVSDPPLEAAHTCILHELLLSPTLGLPTTSHTMPLYVFPGKDPPTINHPRIRHPQIGPHGIIHSSYPCACTFIRSHFEDSKVPLSHVDWGPLDPCFRQCSSFDSAITCLVFLPTIRFFLSCFLAHSTGR